MDRRKCPICGKTMLRLLTGYAPQKNENIVCQNENVIHVERNGQAFLVKTAVNILEELNLPSVMLAN